MNPRLRSRADMPGVRSRTVGVRSMAMSIVSALRSSGTTSGPSRPFDWGQTFHPRSLEFCLNLQGRGEIGAAGKTRGDYAPGNCGYYAIGDEPLAARGRRMTIINLSLWNFRENICKNSLPIAKPISIRQMRAAVFPEKEQSDRLAAAADVGRAARCGGDAWPQPPVPKAAQILWYQSKALELMSHFLFRRKTRNFSACARNGSRAIGWSATKELLARDLANPPTLEMLGQEVGCSPFYLSRIFSREVGLTIPQYLRNAAHGTRRRTLAQRPLQCDRSCDRSRLLQSEPFQQGLLRNDRLLSRSVSDGEKRRSRPLRSLTTIVVPDSFSAE